MEYDANSLKCAIYTRCATDSNTSIERQKQQCEDFAQKNVGAVSGRYSDVARPATEITQRPALQSLMAHAAEKPAQFRLLLVQDTSRLSRKLEDILTISKTVSSQGTTIHFVNEGLSFSDVHFRQLAILNGMIDEAYLAALGQRIREGKRASKKNFRSSASSNGRRPGKKERS